MRRYVVVAENHGRKGGPGRNRVPDDARREALKKYRAAIIAGKTQAFAAKLAGFSHGSLERWEKELGL